MTSYEEYVKENFDKLALDFFKSNTIKTRDDFCRERYENFLKYERIREAKAGDKILDIFPCLENVTVSFDKIINLTKDYATFSVNVNNREGVAFSGKLLIATDDMNKYVENN
jgi:hypothetical protein